MNFTGRGKKVAVTKKYLSYIYILRIFEPQFKAVSYQSEAQTIYKAFLSQTKNNWFVLDYQEEFEPRLYLAFLFQTKNNCLFF